MLKLITTAIGVRFERGFGWFSEENNLRASLESDKGMILSQNEEAVGMEEFNRRVRQEMLAEFKRTFDASAELEAHGS